MYNPLGIIKSRCIIKYNKNIELYLCHPERSEGSSFNTTNRDSSPGEPGSD
jgi:hypothetical protein